MDQNISQLYGFLKCSQTNYRSVWEEYFVSLKCAPSIFWANVSTGCFTINDTTVFGYLSGHKASTD